MRRRGRRSSHATRSCRSRAVASSWTTSPTSGRYSLTLLAFFHQTHIRGNAAEVSCSATDATMMCTHAANRAGQRPHQPSDMAPQVLLMSDELHLDELECLLCLLAGHEEVGIAMLHAATPPAPVIPLT